MKLIGDGADAERVRAVRAARPEVWLGIDANQSLTTHTLDRLMSTLLDAGVQLIEQPFAVGRECDRTNLGSPIPIAADESVQSLEDIAGLIGRCGVLNIKLDKCGGLTEALMMVRIARRLRFKAMIGSMIGTSLAMAPAFVVGKCATSSTSTGRCCSQPTATRASLTRAARSGVMRTFGAAPRCNLPRWTAEACHFSRVSALPLPIFGRRGSARVDAAQGCGTALA